MKVSLRATYGIMAAVDLAMHLGTAPVQAKSIARRQAIPARFLEQVLHGMKKAGLVSSVRGAQGGYVLLKKPSEVSVVEILEALDGPLHSRTADLTVHRRDDSVNRSCCLGKFGNRSIKRSAMCSKP